MNILQTSCKFIAMKEHHANDANDDVKCVYGCAHLATDIKLSH